MNVYVFWMPDDETDKWASYHKTPNSHAIWDACGDAVTPISPFSISCDDFAITEHPHKPAAPGANPQGPSRPEAVFTGPAALRLAIQPSSRAFERYVRDVISAAATYLESEHTRGRARFA